jgi:hypothetical protein
MHVPSDCFQGMSPEVKASQALKNLFTMVAVRVVLAQEEGYDNEGAGTELSKALANFCSLIDMYTIAFALNHCEILI